MNAPPRRRAAVFLLIPLALFALNVWICWRLFFVAYLAQYGSVEPLFFALARHIRDHWPHLGWWPNWYCGMPFQYTYQPLLHYGVALISAASGWDAARSFHVAAGLAYSLGPVALYGLVLRLSNRTGVAAATALLYSLWSPSAALIGAIARDIGSPWNARRLHTTVGYGDGPYMAGLTLLPVAILLADWAIERRGVWRYILAGLAMIAVVLTNIPAALSLAMALAALILTADSGLRIRTALSIAGMSIAGYLLVCFWLPWSALSLMLANTQRMQPSGRFDPQKAVWYAAFALSTLVASWILARLRYPRYVRFAAVFTLITSAIVLGSAWFHVDLVAQPTRFHLVMEMAIAMLLAAALAPLIALHRTIRWVGIAAAVILCVIQAVHYRAFARRIIHPADAGSRSEYKISRWFDQNARGARVLAPGSVAFWLNSITSTPQMKGCCDQNELFPGPRIAYYEFGGDVGAAPERAAEISLVWLRTLGVRYVAMCGPGSTEPFHDILHPAKFDGVLPLRWRDGGDSIFEIPVHSPSLAHVIAPSARIAKMPENGLDIGPLEPYVAALEDPARPAAEFRWTTTSTAEIHAMVPRGDIVSLQVPYHAGWRALSSGHPVPLSKDALGLMVLTPDCNGPCAISLTFNEAGEAIILNLVSTAAWLTAILAIYFQQRRARGNP